MAAPTRRPLQSCSVGYWVTSRANNRGLATAALRDIVRIAFRDMGLHRVQAETLLHNTASQRILLRTGFAQYGMAPKYLKIAGRWQDHLMFQLLNPQPLGAAHYSARWGCRPATAGTAECLPCWPTYKFIGPNDAGVTVRAAKIPYRGLRRCRPPVHRG